MILTLTLIDLSGGMVYHKHIVFSNVRFSITQFCYSFVIVVSVQKLKLYVDSRFVTWIYMMYTWTVMSVWLWLCVTLFEHDYHLPGDLAVTFTFLFNFPRPSPFWWLRPDLQFLVTCPFTFLVTFPKEKSLVVWYVREKQHAGRILSQILTMIRVLILVWRIVQDFLLM